MDSYSNRQIEAANLLKGESPELVDEILQMLGDAEKAPLSGTMDKPVTTEMALKWGIHIETNWRKKASLAAMLISRSFD